VAKALIQVAHDKNVGSVIVGHSRHGRLHKILRGSIVQSLLRLAGDVGVHVVADRGSGGRDRQRYDAHQDRRHDYVEGTSGVVTMIRGSSGSRNAPPTRRR